MLTSRSMPARLPRLLLAMLFTVSLFASLLIARPAMPGLIEDHYSNISAPDVPSLAFAPARETKSGVAYELRSADGGVSFAPDAIEFISPQARTQLRFVGGSASAIEPELRLPGVINELIGDSARAWRANVPTYGSLVYRRLYPGIDLRYDGAGGQLKATYTLAAGVAPELIRWQYGGAQRVSVEQNGDLKVTLGPDVLLTERTPLAWQDIDGQRVPVAARFVVAADQSVGFALGAYSPAHPLIIDPTIEWSAGFGGVSPAEGASIARDSAGNLYMVGRAQRDLPLVAPLQPAFAGVYDAFVLKLDPSGTTVLYSTYLGGRERDEAHSVAIGGDDSIYVFGETMSGDFPLVNPLQNASGLDYTAFVARLNPAGNALIYSTYLNNTLVTGPRSLALGTDGSAYIVGRATGAYSTTPGALKPSCDNFSDGFVARIAADGGSFIYSTCLGGSGFDIARSIALDAAGNAYVVGNTSSDDFPTQNALQASRGSSSAFAAKLNPAGNALVYSTFLPGYARAVAVDAAGSAYVASSIFAGGAPVVGGFDSSYGGGICPVMFDDPCADIYLTRLNPSGAQRLYSTYIGGGGDDIVGDIAVDAAGAVTIVGQSSSADFPLVRAIDSTLAGKDGVVVRLDASGQIDYSTFVGGETSIAYGSAGDDAALSLAVTTDAAFVLARVRTDNFPLTRVLHEGGFLYGGTAVLKLVPEDRPLANIAASTDGPTLVGEPTAFAATTPTLTRASYSWNFGDGTTGSGRTASHTYAAVGNYTATVTATNEAGTYTASTQVNVVVPKTAQTSFQSSLGGGVPTVVVSGNYAYIGEGAAFV
ncbi:MAG: SBBP repeat-containing protein, partial [Roseiflexaceae bacterium]|nr:SBBP repeat-containing protein [Roseiflexaceae bacterium]